MIALFAHDTPFYTSDGEYYSTSITNKILKRYLQVFDNMIVCGRQHANGKLNQGSNLASTDNVTFKNIPYKNAIYIWFNRTDRKNIYEIVKNVDFVVARLDSMIGFLAIKYARELNIPYVVELCTDPWDCYINYGLKGKLLAPWITYKTKKEVKRATNVVYVTNEYLQKKYPNQNNTISISNVECIPDYRAAALKQKEYSLRSDGQTLIIGTAGALLPFKGQRYVIEAINILKNKGLKNVYYKMAGGDGSDRKTLETLIQQYGLNDNVEFCGTLNSSQMKEFYDSLDIYIQPSLQEGLPRTVIEAMSRGLCCLGSRTAGIPELLPKNRIFEKRDFTAIANIIYELSKNDLLIDSQRNIEESKNYSNCILDERRTSYFKKILDSLNKN